MAETFVQVNIPVTAGKKMKTFENVDGGGNTVESEAVVLVDGTGAEVFPATELTALAIADSVSIPSTLAVGAQFAVTNAIAVQVLPANPARRGFVVQNTGNANVRVGHAGVTATTGIRLLPDGNVTSGPPSVPQNAIFAIAEAAASTVFAVEVLP